MKNPDRMLMAIVAGILLVVIAGLAVALLRPAAQFRADDTPEAAVHNYLLALQRDDFARAYSYLSPELSGYPASALEFERDVTGNRWQFGGNAPNVALEVLSARVDGTTALARVRETQFYDAGWFGTNSYSYEHTFTLEREDGAWRLRRGDSYWLLCWHDSLGC
jgi:hypothetical protein